MGFRVCLRSSSAKDKGVLQVDTIKVLARKLDALTRILEIFGPSQTEIVQATEAKMMCEDYDQLGHSGSSFPESVNFINNF